MVGVQPYDIPASASAGVQTIHLPGPRAATNSSQSPETENPEIPSSSCMGTVYQAIYK